MNLNSENFNNADQILNSPVVVDLIDKLLQLIENSNEEDIVVQSLACLCNLIVRLFWIEIFWKDRI